MSYAREYALRPAVATKVVHLLDSPDEDLREDEPDVATPVLGQCPGRGFRPCLPTSRRHAGGGG